MIAGFHNINIFICQYLAPFLLFLFGNMAAIYASGVAFIRPEGMLFAVHRSNRGNCVVLFVSHIPGKKLSSSKEKRNQMKRNVYIDYLKSLGIIFIVITHSTFNHEARIAFLFPFWISMAVPLFMTVSGMNFSVSAANRDMRSIREWYTFKNLYPRFKRILMPFLFVFVFEVIWRIAFKSVDYTVWSLLGGFFSGGYGPGSYYVTILLQFIIVFPLCYFTIKENPKLGGLLIVAANLIFELLIHYYNVDESVYRLMMFRYLIFVMFGIYIYRSIVGEGSFNKVFVIISFLFGAGYLIAISFLHYHNTLFTYWTTTALPSAFYVFPIVYFVIRRKQPSRQSFPGKYFSLLGKASYHIFLVQMVYYYLQVDENFPLSLGLPISLVVCLNVGVLFYLLETKWIGKLYKYRIPQRQT